MWIMTKYGILMPAVRPKSTIKPGDKRELQIRVRDKAALAALRKDMGNKLGATIATPKMDYNFRAYCTHDDFAAVMAREILEINYEKFKPESVDNDLHRLYNDIWFTVYDHYDPSPRSARPLKSRRR